MSQPPPDIETLKAFNSKIADEFRANDGKVGAFEGAELLLLTTTGDKVVVLSPGFGEYQAKTSRVIPLFELQRV